MPILIEPRTHDIGGLEVRRAVPTVQARSVGPFVFVDHIGPHVFAPGKAIDVRPHPHIGLATMTFLWEGTLRHRDSVGSVQDIRPGDVNWMTAGRGIVHSERTPDALRQDSHPIHGMQIWVGLPRAHEDTVPAFFHHPSRALPRLQHAGADITVVAGRSFGEESPVTVFSDTLYASIELAAGSVLTLEPGHPERALYLVEGAALLDGAPIPNQRLIVLDRGTTHRLEASTAVRGMLLGVESLDGPRHLFWNFVSSDHERIEQAKQDWKAGRFDAVPGETEFIPLP